MIRSRASVRYGQLPPTLPNSAIGLFGWYASRRLGLAHAVTLLGGSRLDESALDELHELALARLEDRLRG